MIGEILSELGNYYMSKYNFLLDVPVPHASLEKAFLYVNRCTVLKGGVPGTGLMFE
jgi:hypothetical protein